MKTNLLLFIFVLIIGSGLVFVACGDENDDDDDDNSNSAEQETEWKDTTSGLTWQVNKITSESFPSTKKHCEDLEYAKNKDWRMPNIDELRSLIRNCTGGETGGTCGVTTSCLNLMCVSDCEKAACSSDGKECYWDSALGTSNCTMYWSSDAVADLPDDNNKEHQAWVVNFSNGRISNATSQDENGSSSNDSHSVRCVRK